MLGAIITALLALFVAPGDADALRSTAPAYLTLESAREHLAAARLAAVATGTDADLLLAVAHHESRYDYKAVSNEPGGKVSCSVMTPVPKARCHPSEMGLLAGYMDGARHLRTWLDATKNTRVALLGYAGGYVGIRFCSDPANRKDYRCWTPEVFAARARMIRHARARARAKGPTS